MGGGGVGGDGGESRGWCRSWVRRVWGGRVGKGMIFSLICAHPGAQVEGGLAWGAWVFQLLVGWPGNEAVCVPRWCGRAGAGRALGGSPG